MWSDVLFWALLLLLAEELSLLAGLLLLSAGEIEGLVEFWLFEELVVVLDAVEFVLDVALLILVGAVVLMVI